jgi:hypothetical protein
VILCDAGTAIAVATGLGHPAVRKETTPNTLLAILKLTSMLGNIGRSAALVIHSAAGQEEQDCQQQKGTRETG